MGNGALEGELRKRAAECRNVFFAPFQNQSEMPRTYAACDLFVLPSFGPEESWGLAVNEALCLARPIVVSSHVGCAADLVREGVNGLAFPAGDVAALTDALRNALSDRERLAEWGKAGREIVAKYDYPAATEGLLAALAEVERRTRRAGSRQVDGQTREGSGRANGKDANQSKETGTADDWTVRE